MNIKRLAKPKISTPKMKCDLPIDPKLEKYEGVKACWSYYNFTIIAGLMGQGKTSTTIGLLKSVFPGCFHNVITIIPEISLHSIPEKDNVFKRFPEEDIYHSYDADTLEEIYERLEENASEDYSTLLVIDDFASDFKSNKAAEKVLNRIIIKMRHLHCSIMLLGQNIYQMPKKWREIATNLLCFNLGKSQMSKIFNEFYQYSPKQFDQVMTLYREPHDYLLLNLKHKRLFYKFDEVVFDENETIPC